MLLIYSETYKNGLKLAFPFPFWQLQKTPIMPAPYIFYTKSKANAGPV